MLKKTLRIIFNHLNELDSRTFYAIMGLFLLAFWGCVIWGINLIMTMF